MRYIDSLLPSSADKRYFPFISSQRVYSVPSSRTTPVSPARDTRSPATRPAPLQLPPQTLPGVPGGRPCSPHWRPDSFVRALRYPHSASGAAIDGAAIPGRVARWPASSDAVGWKSSPGFAPGDLPVHSYNRLYDATVDPFRRNRARPRQPCPELRARSRPAGAATLVSSRRFGGLITRIRM